MMMIQTQDTFFLSVGACRLYGEPTSICNVRGLRREWKGSRSRRGRGGVKRDPFEFLGWKLTCHGRL